MTAGTEWIATDAVLLSAAMERGDKKVALGLAVMIDHRIKKIIDSLTEPTVCHEAPEIDMSVPVDLDTEEAERAIRGHGPILGVK